MSDKKITMSFREEVYTYSYLHKAARAALGQGKVSSEGGAYHYMNALIATFFFLEVSLS